MPFSSRLHLGPRNSARPRAARSSAARCWPRASSHRLRLASPETSLREHTETPREDVMVGLDVDQPTRARERRVIGRILRERSPRNWRRLTESATREAMPRSSSMPSKKPINKHLRPTWMCTSRRTVPSPTKIAGRQRHRRRHRVGPRPPGAIPAEARAERTAPRRRISVGAPHSRTSSASTDACHHRPRAPARFDAEAGAQERAIACRAQAGPAAASAASHEHSGPGSGSDGRPTARTRSPGHEDRRGAHRCRRRGADRWGFAVRRRRELLEGA